MKDLQQKLLSLTALVKRYVVVLVMVIFGGMYGFLIYTSSQQAERQPSEVEISNKFQGAKRPKLDESIAQQLTQLEDQNIEIQTLFEEARSNPFAE